MIKKKIQSQTEYYVQFTEEEIKELGINVGDKFSIEECKDGILLKKYETIDIDLSEFSRETLEFLISLSVEKDITISEVIEDILNRYIENNRK